MKQEFQNIEKIEQYLQGELKGSELSSFESAIQQDPVLGNEVELQKAIQESISQARTAELKARMNNISVSTIDPYRGVKIAASVIAGALLTGFLGYQLGGETTSQPEIFDKEEIELVEQEIEQEELTTEDIAFVEEASEKEIIPAAAPTTKPANTSTTSREKEEETIAPALNLPVVNESQMLEDDSEPHLSTNETLPSSGLNSNIESTKIAGDIIVEFESEKGNLQYKFEGPKVFLYGVDKSAKPPIFYDVFMSGTKTTYMKYKDNFYSLDRAMYKKTELLEEKDANIIRELKLRYKD